MRKPKEGRDFTIYAKEAELITQIIDTSFAFFANKEIDKDKIIFRDSYSKVQTDNLDEDEIMFCLFANVGKDTTSCLEALSSQDHSEWRKAIAEELISMEENKFAQEKPVKTIIVPSKPDWLLEGSKITQFMNSEKHMPQSLDLH